MLLFGRLVGSDTDYDEGVYLSSVDALEHGQRLGADVFAPQPPVFYLLLRAISLAGADSVRGFQIGMVVLAVLTCLAAYLLGRAIAGPVAGLTAAALLTVAPPFPLFAHRVLADLPPLGISLLAFWLAWEAKERRSLGIAAAGGAALALAVAVKPNAVLAVVPFLLLLLWERSGRGRMLVAALGGAGVVGAVLVVAYRDVLGELWESVVVYHRDARDTPDVIDKWHELATFLNWRTPFAWLVVAGLAASVLLVAAVADGRRLGAVGLGGDLARVPRLPPPAPLQPSARCCRSCSPCRPGSRSARSRNGLPWRNLALGALALLLVAGYVQQQRRVVLDDVPEEPELVAVARYLERETDPEDFVVSDHSIVPFLADRRVAGPLVDTAMLRFETGSLTDAEVMRVLERWDVRAVVAGRAFAARPQLLDALERRYGAPRRVAGIPVYAE